MGIESRLSLFDALGLEDFVTRATMVLAAQSIGVTRCPFVPASHRVPLRAINNAQVHLSVDPKSSKAIADIRRRRMMDVMFISPRIPYRLECRHVRQSTRGEDVVIMIHSATRRREVPRNVSTRRVRTVS
jgi:hypothetical protein